MEITTTSSKIRLNLFYSMDTLILMGLCMVQVKLTLQGLLFVITGELLNLLAIPLGYCSVLKAEAAGLEFGLATALRFAFKNIPVEGDSQVLIRLLRLHKDCPWRI